jgi:hypothetical protein
VFLGAGICGLPKETFAANRLLKLALVKLAKMDTKKKPSTTRLSKDKVGHCPTPAVDCFCFPAGVSVRTGKQARQILAALRNQIYEWSSFSFQSPLPAADHF